MQEIRAGPTGRQGMMGMLTQGFVRMADFTLGYSRALPPGGTCGAGTCRLDGYRSVARRAARLGSSGFQESWGVHQWSEI